MGDREFFAALLVTRRKGGLLVVDDRQEQPMAGVRCAIENTIPRTNESLALSAFILYSVAATVDRLSVRPLRHGAPLVHMPGREQITDQGICL